MKRQINFKKTTNMALITNVLQVILVLCLSLILFFKSSTLLAHLGAVRWSILFIGLIISWGAIMDIRQAFDAKKILKQRIALESTIENVENLNDVLRAQRHDFLNHLQTVYGLIEMEEYQEANGYIEEVYGSIQSVSQMLRTANPSVNALLQVKLALMNEKGIMVDLSITGSWENLTMPGWEMCRVLGNLLDNAIDALQETPLPKVTIEIGEDIKNFTFSVTNNGPEIDKQLQEKIFEANITTKSKGQGMGLYISKKLMNHYQGTLDLASFTQRTSFLGALPKLIEEKSFSR